MIPVRTRLLTASLAASAAAFIGAAPAQAGPVPSSGATSPLVASATGCGQQTSSQVFLPWADPAEYTLVPGGNFESGAAGWTLSGGAGVAPGNEPFYVGSPTDSSSLSLPAGSSATSATMCVGISNPSLRFFAVNTGAPISTLNVSVQFQTNLGPASLPIGSVAADGTWQPTAPEVVVANLLALLPNNETPVTFTFTPQGAGNWQIDDVYVDPWSKCC